jgi:hypothetical protein
MEAIGQQGCCCAFEPRRFPDNIGNPYLYCYVSIFNEVGNFSGVFGSFWRFMGFRYELSAYVREEWQDLVAGVDLAPMAGDNPNGA